MKMDAAIRKLEREFTRIETDLAELHGRIKDVARAMGITGKWDMFALLDEMLLRAQQQRSLTIEVR